MKVLKTKRTGVAGNEEGFAAIVVAMVLIVILSLITIGFAQLMRHEERSALDKQLSSQAYYAAESGINDAAAAISTNPLVSKTTCGPTVGVGSLFPNNVVGTKTSSSYPCLLINPTPLTLDYSIDTTQSKVTELQGVDSSGNPKAVDRMEISWEDTSVTGKGDASDAAKLVTGGNCNAGVTGTFLPASGGVGSSWAYTGILKAQLIPINDLSRNGLAANAYTAFLCPKAGSGTPTSSVYTDDQGTNGGGIISGACKIGTTNDRLCNMNITSLGALNQSTFFLDMRAIYNPVNVTIKIYGADIAHTQLHIAKAQILVDSTGKAQDVLKRIQVRIPAHNGFAIPDDGTDAMSSICKQLQLTPAVVAASSRGGGSDCTP